MNTTAYNNLNWAELLTRIDSGNVIPVIGQGIYQARDQKNNPVFLYHYLAEQLAEHMTKMKIPVPVEKKYIFSSMVSLYLKEKSNDYLELRKFFADSLSSLVPIPQGPLWKLARIKPFSLFINATHDHFLANALSSVRNYPTEELHHSFREKKTSKVTNDKIDKMDACDLSLIYHIYGSPQKNMVPAYTENDILETIVHFQQDMEKHPKNPFFQLLREKSLLFIGCGYTDWLFRFFIRAIANEPFKFPRDPLTQKFIIDDFNPPNQRELSDFLKMHESQFFYSNQEEDFVDLLFEKVEKECPQHIIPVEEFPDTAFVSFQSDDRDDVRKLVENLQDDGVKVWMDEFELKPGANLAATIIKAINKCPVFIPVISQSSKVFSKRPDIIKYHIREWEWAFSRNAEGKNPVEIIPVKIDETDWMYESFTSKFYVNIPKGNRERDYNKLKTQLLKLQNKKRQK